VLATSSTHVLPALQAFFKPHGQQKGRHKHEVPVLAIRRTEHMVQKHYLTVRLTMMSTPPLPSLQPRYVHASPPQPARVLDRS